MKDRVLNISLSLHSPISVFLSFLLFHPSLPPFLLSILFLFYISPGEVSEVQQ